MLEHSRQELLHALHSVIDEKDLFENGLKHPVFNDLNLYQWVQFLDLHEQRHLTQLKERNMQFCNAKVEEVGNHFFFDTMHSFLSYFGILHGEIRKKRRVEKHV